MNNEIKIPLSKNKIILLFLGAMMFVILGIWFTIDPEEFSNTVYRPRSAELVRIVGVVSTAFFGVCGVFIFKKLFDKKHGLIIDKNGIIDNSNGTSIGLIKWSDIVGIRIEQVHSQKFIMIDVSNPEYYIELKKSRIGKMAMKANFNRYGSPISITANSLKTNFSELKEIIYNEYEKYAPQQRI